MTRLIKIPQFLVSLLLVVLLTCMSGCGSAGGSGESRYAGGSEETKTRMSGAVAIVDGESTEMAAEDVEIAILDKGTVIASTTAIAGGFEVTYRFVPGDSKIEVAVQDPRSGDTTRIRVPEEVESSREIIALITISEGSASAVFEDGSSGSSSPTSNSSKTKHPDMGTPDADSSPKKPKLPKDGTPQDDNTSHDPNTGTAGGTSGDSPGDPSTNPDTDPGSGGGSAFRILHYSIGAANFTPHEKMYFMAFVDGVPAISAQNGGSLVINEVPVTTGIANSATTLIERALEEGSTEESIEVKFVASTTSFTAEDVENLREDLVIRERVLTQSVQTLLDGEQRSETAAMYLRDRESNGQYVTDFGVVEGYTSGDASIPLEQANLTITSKEYASFPVDGLSKDDSFRLHVISSRPQKVYIAPQFSDQTYGKIELLHVLEPRVNATSLQSLKLDNQEWLKAERAILVVADDYLSGPDDFKKIAYVVNVSLLLNEQDQGHARSLHLTIPKNSDDNIKVGIGGAMSHTLATPQILKSLEDAPYDFSIEDVLHPEKDDEGKKDFTKEQEKELRSELTPHEEAQRLTT